MESIKLDVSCLGTCNIDFISKVPYFASSDEEINVEKLFFSLGGSALNFASRISSLGFKTGILSRVGKDYYGELVRTELEHHLEICNVIPIEGNTGMAFIAIDDTGRKSVYSYIGVNSRFKLEKEDINLIKHSNLLHVTGMYWEVAEKASRYSNRLSFNPGPALCSIGIDKLKKTIKKTEILFLNHKEVYILTRMNEEDGISYLVELGVPVIVVTRGSEGARLFTEDETIFSPSIKVNAVDTTGAGDNFAAGFVAAYLKNEKLKYCLDYANQVASSCVQQVGGSLIPTKNLTL
ncbi:MAG: carbohydrate kinase family protein [Methanobacteriaceae archaeon]|nr:carbohydrate kinase family protein [Methanobacteriaceae archaeon]